MFGFLNVYKPKGKTSHDVVAILRRITKIKQIGHTGTLDPFAEGVLPICIGKATRLIEYLNDDKAYIGTVKLGESTTTFDIEGEIVKENNTRIADLDEIESALNQFRGDIEQIPPIYSAIKINGKKLYEYARKGEEVEIKARKVNISELRVINYDIENKLLELYIACSKGTYIRSIANDLGEKLGTYGHLSKLVRVKAGKFEIKNSVKLEELDSLAAIQSNLIYPLEYVDYPQYELNEAEITKISNGNSINVNQPDGILLLVSKGELLAVSEVKDGVAKCKKVLT